MQSSVERLDKNRVSIEVGLDPAEVDQALNRAYQRVVQRVKVPGFRQGKAPRSILEAQYGPAVLHEDALDILISDGYGRALTEHQLEPIEQPKLDVVEPLAQGKPFVFRADVAVLPEVVLGQYTQVKAEKPRPVIEEAQVNERREALREQYAELVLADHEELAAGDFAVVDFEGFIDGQPFPGGAAQGHTIEIGGGGYIPGFTEGMIGMHSGEAREIKVDFPEDYKQEDLAGKPAVFHVTLREIKTKELPELDDEFAKSLGKENMEALTAEIRQSMQNAADQEAERIFTQRVVDRVVAEAELDLPGVLVEQRIEQNYRLLIRNMAYQGIDFEKYREVLGKTEDEIKEELRPRSEAEVRRDLVLNAVRKAEKIEPEPEQIEERLKALAAMANIKDFEGFKKDLRRSGRLASVIDDLAREQAVKFLVDAAEAVPEKPAKAAGKAKKNN